ncbi:NAD(P)H-dependent flavin oxidoreductase [Corallococcus macrosporus]|uniref:Propionate 3-nitronate monooxygenase n=1 Tax=Corallococcus macrosporus DSM 14697 TaxID=1189310 RepID=A0A250JRX9_9BACT|nr:nitronate monooxygenase [Corallococcus macrosporus]ATB46634.1 2-nitropropane dioxygenase [Corallococcus macrosporus DSM 14697]
MSQGRPNKAIQKLGIQHPIIQGPFGGGNSTERLAAAVSNLGGLGSYGAHQLPPEELGRVAQRIRALTDRPFALNLWVSDHDVGGDALSPEAFDRAYQLFEPYYRELGVEKPAMPERFHHRFEDQVEALLEARPPVFSFVFGVPSAAILAECRRRGILTSGAATTLAEAEALDAAGVDLIVATGFEAGGHRPSFLARAEDSLMGTMALTPLVADRVKAPVIAAGGLADGRGIRAVLTLGAQAAQLGTAFLVCEESGTTDAHRELLFSDRAKQTTLTRAFTGRLARGLRNRWTEEMAARQTAFAPYPIQSWFLSKLKPAAVQAGRTDLVSLWAGQAAPNLRHRTVPTLMEALIKELSAA